LDAPDTVPGGPAFERIVDQWARSQMDSALATIARLDDAAKQLIGLGGVLQGVYFVGFKFGAVGGPLVYVGILIVFVPLVLMILFAAQSVCRVQLGASAMAAYRLLRDGRESGVRIDVLNDAVDGWCGEIDRVVAEKRRWVHLANITFVLATVAGLVTLVLLMLSPESPAN
jgi:hypothetical protein